MVHGPRYGSYEDSVKRASFDEEFPRVAMTGLTLSKGPEAFVRTIRGRRLDTLPEGHVQWCWCWADAFMILSQVQ